MVKILMVEIVIYKQKLSSYNKDKHYNVIRIYHTISYHLSATMLYISYHFTTFNGSLTQQPSTMYVWPVDSSCLFSMTFEMPEPHGHWQIHACSSPVSSRKTHFTICFYRSVFSNIKFATKNVYYIYIFLWTFVASINICLCVKQDHKNVELLLWTQLLTQPT